MSFLRNVWTDLVEKRLWPVALGLLVALVAVPVLLGGGASGAATPLVAADGTTGPGAVQAEVTLQPTDPARRNRLGLVRNPFKQHKFPVGATGVTGLLGAITTQEAGTAASAGGGGGSKPSSGGSSDPTGTTGQTGTTTSPTPTPAPAKPKQAENWVANVRFGRVGTHRTPSQLSRLEPAGSSDNPFLVFVGVVQAKDFSHRAVFLLSSDVTAEGEGTCRPTPKSCETVELIKGDTERLAVKDADGVVRGYYLTLDSVTHATSSTGGGAASARSTTASGAPGAVATPTGPTAPTGATGATGATAATGTTTSPASAPADEAAAAADDGTPDLTNFAYDPGTGTLRRLAPEPKPAPAASSRSTSVQSYVGGAWGTVSEPSAAPLPALSPTP